MLDTRTRRSYRGLSGVALAALLSLGLAACSSVPDPAGEMAVARSTVERVGALPNVAATAPVEMQQAHDKLAKAEQAYAAGHKEEARRLAEEAEADARVAESRAYATQNQKALGEAQHVNQVLKEEMTQGGTQQHMPAPHTSHPHTSRPHHTSQPHHTPAHGTSRPHHHSQQVPATGMPQPHHSQHMPAPGAGTGAVQPHQLPPSSHQPY